MSNLVIRKVTDASEFESLREVWDELLEKSPDRNIYLTWEWLFTWWKHYGAGKQLNILLIQDDNQTIGIVPLMRSRYKKGLLDFNLLENIGTPTSDYGGIILTQKESEAMLALIGYLKKEMASCDLILRMSQIREDSQFISLLRQLYPTFSNSLICDEREIASPYVLLPATWNEYFGSFSSKTRNTLRRKWRSLEKEHDIQFKKCNLDDNIADSVHAFSELHQKGWQSRNIKGVFADTKAEEFFLDIASIFSKKGWLNLSFLLVDGDLASAVYGFECDQKFYYTIPAFNPGYSKYSPGNLHIMRLVEYSIGKGLKEFDFLRGDEAYKLRWHTVSRNNIQIVIMERKPLSNLRLKLLYAFLRWGELSQRGWQQNYYLYWERRRQRKARRAMNEI